MRADDKLKTQAERKAWTKAGNALVETGKALAELREARKLNMGCKTVPKVMIRWRMSLRQWFGTFILAGDMLLIALTADGSVSYFVSFFMGFFAVVGLILLFDLRVVEARKENKK